MPATINFFPLGNADSVRLDLANGKKILVDYANMRDPNDDSDKRCDLPEILRSDLRRAGRKDFDAVCITHIDTDHCKGFGDFFWLQHAAKYQNDTRVKIKELWVPAAALIEDGIDGDPRLVRTEARHRFKEGKDILVFSRPERLKQYCKDQGIDFEARKHLIIDAGKLVPGYSVDAEEKCEFFVHSPFASRQNDNSLIARNEDAIVMHVTIREGTSDSGIFLGADSNHETLGEIVRITKSRKNETRLQWDIMKLPHHCSYTAIGPECGDDETKPTPDTKYLFEDCRQDGSHVVSPSKPIPTKGSAEDKDKQPPHRAAANYHKRISKNRGGKFEVTMEHPSSSSPKPFGYKITVLGVALITGVSAPATVVGSSNPRAG